MPGTEQPCPTSVRSLTGGARPQDVVAGMAAKLPEGGMASADFQRAGGLLAATYRLLDSRILAAAVSCLDQDVGPPLAAWLARYQNLSAAAARTRADPDRREEVVFKKPHALACTQTTTVVVHVQEQPFARFPFTLALTMDLGRTAVSLARGEIHEIECVVAALTATFTFADVSPPLWTGKGPRSVLRVSLDPPVPVPFARADGAAGPPVPTAREGEPARRTTVRPPVPTANGRHR